MVKLLRKDRIKFYSLFVITNIFCVIFLLSAKKEGIDLITSATSANYIALVMNNLYIYYMFQKSKKLKAFMIKLFVELDNQVFLISIF